ncbi:unnamed protein product [Lymnaea stagnalis]|uniref:Transmembrane protein n=1 Tax=Lymnaea stagnalis TaxID=6523 RepID=A0AAV2HV71_LYMST
MSQKKIAEELSKEIREYDNSRDLPVSVGISIGAVALSTSVISVLACYAVYALETYRKDVSAFWMACVPFVFPVITGIATTYRRQMSTVGMHICLVLATLLTGAAGYGYTIDTVYIKRDNCTMVSESIGDCDKDSLVYIYVISGGVAIGLSVISLGISALATYSSMRSRAERRLNHQQSLELTMLSKEASNRTQKPIYIPLSTSPSPSHHMMNESSANHRPTTPSSSAYHNGAPLQFSANDNLASNFQPLINASPFNSQSLTDHNAVSNHQTDPHVVGRRAHHLTASSKSDETVKVPMHLASLSDL